MPIIGIVTLKLKHALPIIAASMEQTAGRPKADAEAPLTQDDIRELMALNAVLLKLQSEWLSQELRLVLEDAERRVEVCEEAKRAHTAPRDPLGEFALCAQTSIARARLRGTTLVGVSAAWKEHNKRKGLSELGQQSATLSELQRRLNTVMPLESRLEFQKAHHL